MNKNREVPIRIIVRPRRHAVHHGGAWKVAFADFMTAMFALFLVLWLVNQSSDVKSAVAGYFQDPLGRADEYGSSILPGEGSQSAVPQLLTPPDVLDLRRDRMQALAADIERQLRQLPDFREVADKVEIEVVEEGLRIQLLEDAKGTFFHSGSPVPSGRGREILGVLGRRLGRLQSPVRIEGHTDSRPYSMKTDYGNWELSADRANSARRILRDSGLQEGQVREVRGHADRELRERANPYSPRNRRIAITVLLPPLEPAPDAAPGGALATPPAGAAPPGDSAVSAAPTPTRAAAPTRTHP